MTTAAHAPMKISTFIDIHMPAILADWERHAATMLPAAESMDVAALRDHAEQILRVVAADIDSAQSPQEQKQKSLGTQDDASQGSAASRHGALRHNSQFTLLQLSSEFRALRASVLRLWLPHHAMNPHTIDTIIRFNEAIDRALAESIVTYSRQSEIARDMFAGILSHDLRGPLATVSMVGGLLAEPRLAPARVPQLGIIVTRAARQMSAMVNDLLGVTSAKLGGGIPILLGAANLATLCAAAIEDANAMHPASVYALDTSGDLDGAFDGVRLHQLLVNLLGNAAQHGTPGRPIRVQVRGEPAAFTIAITNEGIEIQATKLAQLFEPMVQLTDRRAGGSATSLGLGLFVAREIAKGHGGGIEVSTAPGENTFTVQLPRDRSAAERALERLPAVSGLPERYALSDEAEGQVGVET